MGSVVISSFISDISNFYLFYFFLVSLVRGLLISQIFSKYQFLKIFSIEKSLVQLLMSTSKAFFMSISVLNLQHFFIFFLEFLSLWLNYLSVLSRCLLVPIKPLSILIIVWDKVWSDVSNIPAGMLNADAHSVSSNFVLLSFGVPCNFFVERWTCHTGEATPVNRSLVI